MGIGDYAIIGDCHSAALVSRQGSLDWLCWPRFDSPSLFGALLDPRAGHWRIAPAGEFRARRRYVGDSNVLETHFLTASGSLRLTDLMPVASEGDKRRLLLADHEVLRVATCDHGEVALDFDLCARPDYGRGKPRVTRADGLGVRIALRPGVLSLRSELPLVPDPDDPGRVRGHARLRAGDTLSFSLIFEDEWPAIMPPLGAWSRACVDRTVAWWSDWVGRMRYGGPYRDAVVRSALALRLLLYAPSGAFVAAPTTSLPERIGGPLNWDYRFCWLRDASLTIRALFGLGFQEEGEAFLGWLLHTTRLTRPRLRVLYDVYGRVPPREQTLDHLAGYAGSRPVRIGNAAIDQLQLDVYGEIIDAAAQFAARGGTFDRETQRLLTGFGDYVVRHWACADEGIWEPRSGRRHHTHSRLLCWVAMDRLWDLHQKTHVTAAKVADYGRARERIAASIREQAWSAPLGSYASTLGGDELDASTLLLAWYGFEDPASERMRHTYARLVAALGAGRSLLRRYRNGDSPGEGAFGVCGFWGAEYLALGGGSADDASSTLARLLELQNDVGLYAEEIDPASGQPLGNFPQAFTHVGLINAALSLEQRLAGRAAVPHEVPPRPAQAAREAARV